MFRHAASHPDPSLRPRVLLVDADADTRDLYRQLFPFPDWDVTEASEGREALTTALINPPHLIVTDTRLPLIDGYALCEILRRDSATKGVRILVITSEGQPAAAQRAHKAGADTVLVKPTMPTQVLAEAQRLLAPPDEAAPRVVQTERRSSVTTPTRKSRRLSKSHPRFATTTPPAPPPLLVCPSCDRGLAYAQSFLGGVNGRQPEQWDQFTCPTGCGAFQYRQRTRELRRLL